MSEHKYQKNVVADTCGHGDIFCQFCGRRLGSIPNSGQKYINMVFVCNCGHETVFYSNKLERLPYTKDELYIKINNNDAVCRKCKRTLFNIETSSFKTFGFHIVCNCEREYNMEFDSTT